MKSFFEKIKSAGMFITALISVCGVMLMLIHEAYDHTIPQKACNHLELTLDEGEVSRVVINGDTTRRIYLVNDTITNMLWLGIGGKIVTRSK